MWSCAVQSPLREISKEPPLRRRKALSTYFGVARSTSASALPLELVCDDFHSLKGRGARSVARRSSQVPKRLVLRLRRAVGLALAVVIPPRLLAARSNWAPRSSPLAEGFAEVEAPALKIWMRESRCKSRWRMNFAFVMYVKTRHRGPAHETVVKCFDVE